MNKSKNILIVVSPNPKQEKDIAENVAREPNKTLIEYSGRDNEPKKHENGLKEQEEELVEEEIEIMELIMDRIGDSKTHGLGNIVKAKSNILRLIWIICLLASVSYCVYECVIALIVYFQYSVVPTSSPIYEAPSIFPSVDVCNIVPFDATAAASQIATIASKYSVSSSNYSNPKDYTNGFSTLIKANLAKQAIMGTFDTFNAGFNLPDMLMSCFFEGTACNQSNFYQYQDFDYNNCFSFNMGQVNNAGGTASMGNTPTTTSPILSANFPGAAKGFQLEMYTGSPDNQGYSASNGLRVVVHNQSIVAFPVDDGLSVPTGMQTDLVVKRTFYYHLNAPYSNCLTDPVDYTQNSILQVMASNYSVGTVVYKQSFCLKVCLQQYIINNCGCYDMGFPSSITNDTILRGCYDPKDLTCIDSTYLQYINNNQDSYCYAQCPLECTEIIIELAPSYSNYPTQWYANQMLNNSAFLTMVAKTAATNFTPTVSFLQSNTLQLNVYYNTMGYMVIQESAAVTVDVLIAQFGGNVGLFLGMTFMSLIEIVEVVFYMIYFNIKKLIQKKKDEKEEKKILY